MSGAWDTGSMGIDSLLTEWAWAVVKIRGVILGSKHWGGGEELETGGV